MTKQPCHICKKEISSTAKFCNFCGTKVIAVSVSAPADLTSLNKYVYRPAVEALATHPDFEKGFSNLQKKIPDIIEKLVDTQPAVSSTFLPIVWDALAKDNIWLLVKFIDWATKIKAPLPREISTVLEQNDDPLVQRHLKQYVCQK